MEDEHRFRSLLLGAGTEFIQKLKKLASSRSGNGSPMMTDETAVRELVRLDLASDMESLLRLWDSPGRIPVCVASLVAVTVETLHRHGMDEGGCTTTTHHMLNRNGSRGFIRGP